MDGAPSSEFVSSSIPSWQILTAHVQPFRGSRNLAFCLKVPLDSLLLWASSGGSGETAQMRRLAWTFAARIGDKYQIRLTRPDGWFSLQQEFSHMSHLMTKPTKWLCAQRRLRSAWASAQSDQSSLCAQWVAQDPVFLHANSEDSDQTGLMPRLIWVFPGRTVILLILSWGGSYQNDERVIYSIGLGKMWWLGRWSFGERRLLLLLGDLFLTKCWQGMFAITTQSHAQRIRCYLLSIPWKKANTYT